MAQNLDLFLGLGSLFAVGQDDLNADHPKSDYTGGAVSMMVDRFGFRIFRYTRMVQLWATGGMLKGEMQGREAFADGTVTAVTGETNDVTHLSDTGTWTIMDDSEVGNLCIVTVDAGGAGAAPEGEVAIVVRNTSSVLTFDADYALTAAPAATDTYKSYSIFVGKDSAALDNACDVFGVCMQDRAIGNWGWVQAYGYNPGTLYTTAAVATGAAIVADTAAVKTLGAAAEDLWVGHCPVAVQADLASPFRSAAFIDLIDFCPGAIT
jgi:hypothetical protein